MNKELKKEVITNEVINQALKKIKADTGINYKTYYQNTIKKFIELKVRIKSIINLVIDDNFNSLRIVQEYLDNNNIDNKQDFIEGISKMDIQITDVIKTYTSKEDDEAFYEMFFFYINHSDTEYSDNLSKFDNFVTYLEDELGFNDIKKEE